MEISAEPSDLGVDTLVRVAGAETLASPDSIRPRERNFDDSLRCGEQVGRYVVLERIGAGGMGVVYAAYDPELDRKVALKILSAGSTHAGSGAARLQREAQALARLSHPNVIAVHDVGMLGERVFVAMEFIEGKTLSRWLKAEPRPWQEIIKVLIAAGQGLAAAHAANLIHRDFKPENVLIGSNGRVVVVDFGLARQGGSLDPALEAGTNADERTHPGSPSVSRETMSSASMSASLATPLTRTGGVMGTPAYMAPEQHLGIETDPRTDQFAFCVALYEALFQRRPFHGEDAHALAFQVTHSPARMPPRDTSVPLRVRKIVLRGLSLNPEARYPSMPALLAALSAASAPAKWSKWLAAAAVAVAFTGAAAWAMSADWSGISQCQLDSERIGSAWDVRRQQTIEASFLASGRPFAAQTWARTRTILNDYAETWTRAYANTCDEDTGNGSGGSQHTTRTTELRLMCLDQAMQSFTALLSVLDHAEPTTIERAVQAAYALPVVRQCDDPQSLWSSRPLADERSRERMRQSDSALAHARARYDAGDLLTAERRVRAVVQRARAGNQSSVLGRALLLLGLVQEAQSDHEIALSTLHQAAATADSVGDDDTRARALIAAIRVAGYRLARFEEARRLAEFATGAVQRLRQSSDLSAQLATALGIAALGESKLSQAEAHLRTALMQREAMQPSDPLTIASVLSNMGVLHVKQGRYDVALQELERARGILERELGPAHKQAVGVLNNIAGVRVELGQYEAALDDFHRLLAMTEQLFDANDLRHTHALVNIGITLRRLNRFEEALTHLQQARALFERAATRSKPDEASVYSALGDVMHAMRRPREALAYYQRAAEINREVLGNDHPQTAEVELRMGDAHLLLREHERAEALVRRAIDVWSRHLGPQHPQLGVAFAIVGEIELSRGRFSESLAWFERGVAVMEPALGLNHPDLARLLVGLGHARGEMGLHEESVAAFERAIALASHETADIVALNHARFGLARALIESDPRHALALGRLAHAELRAKLPDEPELAIMAGWLNLHESRPSVGL